MKRLLSIPALLLLLAACGAKEVDGPVTTDPGTLPGAAQSDLLAEARLVWSANEPDSYEFTYELACECDQGPWRVRVERREVVSTVGPEAGGSPPYVSIDAILDEIAATLTEGRFPVDVEYDGDFGYPRSYIFNEPAMAFDGGFVLSVTSLEPSSASGDLAKRQALVAALSRWEDADVGDYDYIFTRRCFCPQEFVGPYEASVLDGTVVSATYQGTDLLDIELLNLTDYDELVWTVDGVFAEIERALAEADRFEAEYHPELGYPTSVFIDWIANAADDEESYLVENLSGTAGS